LGRRRGEELLEFSQPLEFSAEQGEFVAKDLKRGEDGGENSQRNRRHKRKYVDKLWLRNRPLSDREMEDRDKRRNPRMMAVVGQTIIRFMVRHPMITRGCRAGSFSAETISSRTIQGMFPSPKRRKPMFAAMGLSADQPK